MAGGGGDGGELDVNINLTALLDVLTNLLFFLMFGFAAQRASMEIDGSISLPVGKSKMPPQKTVQVTIAREELRVEKIVVAALKAGKVTGNSGGRIEPLYKRLVEVKQKRTPVAPADEDVLFILCDKDTPYALMRHVMMTGAEAGFPKFRLAVLAE
jgi:biopolymer transport protein TolR